MPTIIAMRRFKSMMDTTTTYVRSSITDTVGNSAPVMLSKSKPPNIAKKLIWQGEGA